MKLRNELSCLDSIESYMTDTLLSIHIIATCSSNKPHALTLKERMDIIKVSR